MPRQINKEKESGLTGKFFQAAGEWQQCQWVNGATGKPWPAEYQIGEEEFSIRCPKGGAQKQIARSQIQKLFRNLRHTPLKLSAEEKQFEKQFVALKYQDNETIQFVGLLMTSVYEREQFLAAMDPKEALLSAAKCSSTCPPEPSKNHDLQVTLSIFEAKDVLAADWIASGSDCYVKVFVIGKNGKKEIHRTQVRARTTTPVWNNTVKFDIDLEEDTFLRIELWDEDYLSQDDNLGRIDLFLEDIMSDPARYSEAQWLDIQAGPWCPEATGQLRVQCVLQDALAACTDDCASTACTSESLGESWPDNRGSEGFASLPRDAARLSL